MALAEGQFAARKAATAVTMVKRTAQRRWNHQRADFGRQPPSQDHGAVFVLIHVQGTARVLAGRLASFARLADQKPVKREMRDSRRTASPNWRESPLVALLQPVEPHRPARQ